MPFKDHEMNLAYWRWYHQVKKKGLALGAWTPIPRKPPGIGKRAKTLQRLYGITKADYDRMLAAQGGCCLICRGGPSDRKTKNLFVDHDHVTRRIRGILCHRCNSGISYFRENHELLLRAALYVMSDGDRSVDSEALYVPAKAVEA